MKRYTKLGYIEVHYQGKHEKMCKLRVEPIKRMDDTFVYVKGASYFLDEVYLNTNFMKTFNKEYILVNEPFFIADEDIEHYEAMCETWNRLLEEKNDKTK